MTSRAILIQLRFDNIAEIERIRAVHDPLFGKTAPHITLVFPFCSDIRKEHIAEHVNIIAVKNEAFRLKMRGIGGEDTE